MAAEIREQAASGNLRTHVPWKMIRVVITRMVRLVQHHVDGARRADRALCEQQLAHLAETGQRAPIVGDEYRHAGCPAGAQDGFAFGEIHRHGFFQVHRLARGNAHQRVALVA